MKKTESPLSADSIRPCASDQYGRDVRKASGASGIYSGNPPHSLEKWSLHMKLQATGSSTKPDAQKVDPLLNHNGERGIEVAPTTPSTEEGEEQFF